LLSIFYVKKRREAKEKMDKVPMKEKGRKKRKIFMQPSFHLFSRFRREKLFSSMEHCRIRLSPLSFYLIFFQIILATISNHTCTS
jgi:hypothetical protein